MIASDAPIAIKRPNGTVGYNPATGRAYRAACAGPCCCPGPALQLVVDGVTTIGGRKDLACSSVVVDGEFVNGTFNLSKTPWVRYFPKDSAQVFPAQAVEVVGGCSFAASRVNDYGPLKSTILTNPSGICDDDSDPSEREGSYCIRIIGAMVVREGANEDGVPLWRVQIGLDTSWYSEASNADGNDPGMIFEAVFAWDGTGSITVANDTASPWFSGGTVTITVSEDTTPTIPGDVDEECHPALYVVQDIRAGVYCRGPGFGWSRTSYGAYGHGLQFWGPTCADAEKAARARLARWASVGLFYGTINTGWRPVDVPDEGGSVGDATYSYLLGYCVNEDDIETMEDIDPIFGHGEEFPGGVGNSVEAMPYFGTFGYAPHDACGATGDTHLFFHYIAGGNCSTGGELTVTLTTIYCERWMPPDGTPPLGVWELIGVAPYAVWERWEMGGVCVGGGETIELPTPPAPPDAAVVTDFCAGGCVTCGDGKFSPDATADVEIWNYGASTSTRQVATGLTLDPESCTFSGEGRLYFYNSPDGTGDAIDLGPITTNAAYNGDGTWTENNWPGNPSGSSGSSGSGTVTEWTISVHDNACEEDELP